MFKVVFKDGAAEDISISVAYYDDELGRPDLTELFYQELYDARDKLCANPQFYSFLESEPLLRFVRFKKLSFNIIFEIIGDDEVHIYAVRHTSRLPFV